MVGGSRLLEITREPTLCVAGSAPCILAINMRIKKRRGFFSRVLGLMPSVLIRANYENYIGYICGRLLRQLRFCRCTQSDDPGRRLSAGLDVEGGQKGKSRNEWRLRANSRVSATDYRWRVALACLTTNKRSKAKFPTADRFRSPHAVAISAL